MSFLEWTGSLMLSAPVLAVPLLTMVSCLCPRRWEFEGQWQLQTIRLCVCVCPRPWRRTSLGERERARESGMLGDGERGVRS